MPAPIPNQHAPSQEPLTPENLDEYVVKASVAIKICQSLDELENLRVSVLGKKGKITDMMKGLGQLSGDERKEVGANLNKAKTDILEKIEQKKEDLARAEMEVKLAGEKLDVTLPIRPEQKGSIHPITQTIDEIVEIFADMGFTVAEGPDIEDDFHNFTALNIPEDHPARQMHDTFYLPQTEDGRDRVLRTHTSPVQIRTMCNEKPPIRIIAPGRTYRSDYDMTHTPMFHQIEALVIDDKTTMAELKGCLLDFCRQFFGIDDLPVRYRPSFFPFTEPSAEMDIGCSREGGTLKIGAGKDWLEILGCGMVHPNVLKNCGIDPDKYQGFAFGMGIERLAMLKYGIPDLRTFFESDLRWMRHYGFDFLRRPSLGSGL